ncbi:hypothetical protein ACOMHN_007878 [Nucella lapillus]
MRLQEPIIKDSKDGFPSKLHQESLASVLLSMGGDVPITNVTDSCRFIMNHMAEQGGDFTYCLLSNARPFRMCEQCVVYYTRFTNLYQDLLNGQVCAIVQNGQVCAIVQNDQVCAIVQNGQVCAIVQNGQVCAIVQNGQVCAIVQNDQVCAAVQNDQVCAIVQNDQSDQLCAPALLLADRMQVLTTIDSTFTSLWAKADCIKCYESVTENTTTGNVTYKYTADTLLFQEMHANVSRCFNDSDTIDASGVNAVCKQCKSIYTKMNDKFFSIQANSGGHICMDLVDMMNYTRLMWSSQYHCTRPRPDASIVITLSVLVFVVTILLYLSSKFIAKIRMPHIFKGAQSVGLFKGKRPPGAQSVGLFKGKRPPGAQFVGLFKGKRPPGAQFVGLFKGKRPPGAQFVGLFKGKRPPGAQFVGLFTGKRPPGAQFVGLFKGKRPPGAQFVGLFKGKRPPGAQFVGLFPGAQSVGLFKGKQPPGAQFVGLFKGKRPPGAQFVGLFKGKRPPGAQFVGLFPGAQSVGLFKAKRTVSVSCGVKCQADVCFSAKRTVFVSCGVKCQADVCFSAKRMATGSGRYGSLSREEVDTSLPRFTSVSPAYTTCAERRHGDGHRDVDGNGYPVQTS